MKRHPRKVSSVLGLGKLLVIGVVAAGLAGCADDLGSLGDRGSATAGPQVTQASAAEAVLPGPTALIDARLVPVPDEFLIEDGAVWDGERTLQGIWVAHPAAQTARRVRILNIDTGYAVDGALFRRDETGSGPAVLVSSDAAAALGMTPEKEVQLSIVAIKRAPPVVPVAEATPPEPAAQDDGGTEELAVAAIEPETEEESEALSGAAESAEPEADQTTPLEASAVTPAEGAETQRLASELQGASQRSVAELNQGDLEAASSAVAEAGQPTAGDWQPAPAAESPAPRTSPRPSAAPQIELEPVSEEGETIALVAPQAVSPLREVEIIPEPEQQPAAAEEAAPESSDGGRADSFVEDWPLVLEQADAPPADPLETEPTENTELALAASGPEQPAPSEPAPQITAAVTESELDRPFIQAGLFGVESNAARLIKVIEEAGFPAQGKLETYGERLLTRVIAGPFQTQADLDQALRTIRRIGPSDALPVAR